MEATQERNINIYTESNPNPNSLKFVVNFLLLPEGVSRDFADKDSAKNAPLAAELFDFPMSKEYLHEQLCYGDKG